MEINGNNEETHLVLRINRQTQVFDDITQEVLFAKYESNYWSIFFKKNGGKSIAYKYYKDSIKVSINPKVYEVIDKNIYYNDKIIKNVYKIIKFDNLGYKLFCKNGLRIFINTKPVILSSDLTSKFENSNVFNYYKDLANYASNLSLDELSIGKLQYDLYKKIGCINNQSVLRIYIDDNIKDEYNKNEKYIFPFETNYSQMNAIEKAFSNRLSVISGPPGTGKTQVILNIIANAVINEEKIAIISNNNTAVENIYSKLKNQNLEFFVANLGNSNNVTSFFEKKDFYKLRAIDYQKSDINKKEIHSISSLAKKLFEYNNKLTIIKIEKIELEEEFLHFENKYSKSRMKDLEITYNSYEKYLELEQYLINKKSFNFFNRLFIRFKYKIKNINNKNVNLIINELIYRYYLLKIKKLEDEIYKINNYLIENDSGKVDKLLVDKSMKFFKNYLFNKYHDLEFFDFTKDNYKKFYNLFLNRYPVTLSTTQSLLRNCYSNFMYDLVVIDEASQSDILSTLLTMNVAKRMVIVGDQKQLSQIENTDIYEASDMLIKKYNIKKCYQYKDNSIISSVLSLSSKISNVVLKEHYRCDYSIIQFCNRMFYNNELMIYTKKNSNNPFFIVHTVEGNHARRNPNGTGQYNDRESEEIVQILKNIDETDIGIISPFRAQVDYIKSKISSTYPDVEVDTIHKYQGRQKKVIILSTVVNNLDYEKNELITDFITDSRLLNVAVSRAIDKLYLVVSNGVYNSEKNNIKQLIDYINYYYPTNNEKGKINSIFDSLYRDSYKILINTKLYKKVDSYAETLMIELLNSVLNNYKTYRFTLHVNLLSLINSVDGFTEKEIAYIKNNRTHVDFVIYDIVTHKPKLCIEVDGTKFHDYSLKQIKHDEVKSKVLKNNGLILLRLKTNGNSEKEKLIELLNSI